MHNNLLLGFVLDSRLTDGKLTFRFLELKCKIVFEFKFLLKCNLTKKK